MLAASIGSSVRNAFVVFFAWLPHVIGAIAVLVIGYFVARLVAVFSLAASVLGVAALTAFVGAVWAYLPNVVAAFLIFLVASALAGGIAAVVDRAMGDTSLGRIARAAAPVLIMAIAVFMILEQLKIATAIVTITYAALLGAIALGSALAFGLGGRDVAAQMLPGAYDKGRENSDQFKRDLDRGKERAQELRDSDASITRAQPGSIRTT